MFKYMRVPVHEYRTNKLVSLLDYFKGVREIATAEKAENDIRIYLSRMLT